MKIQTTSIPEWFYNSEMFQLETDSNDKNYNSPKQRIFHYDTFPTFTSPSNKIAAHPEYDYGFMKSQENNSVRIDPGQRVGYNRFPKFTGVLANETTPFLNAYANDQQIAFKNEGGSLYDDQNPLNLGGGTTEHLQWINGEQGIGYSINPSETDKLQKMNTFLNQCRSYQPNTKFGIYSLPAFSIFGQFYNINETSVRDTLCGYLETPPDSIHELCGFDYLMEDLYAINSSKTQFYIALGMFEKQLARKKYLLTNKEIYNKFYYILWSHTEFFGFQLRYRKNTNELITCGELDGLTKAPSNPNYTYSIALAAMTTGDGLIHFNDRFCTFGTVDINGTMRDLEIENVDASPFVSATLRNQTYTVGPAIVWLGVNQYVALAIWQASLNKDIIEDTTYDWFTPDFINSTGTLRTGNNKQIPYNLYYHEPTFEVKYSANKNECLIYACNFDSINPSPETTTVIVKDKNNNDVQIPITLKGLKAELVRVTF